MEEYEVGTIARVSTESGLTHLAQWDGERWVTTWIGDGKACNWIVDDCTVGLLNLPQPGSVEVH